jgi:hypothetical protein
VSGYYLFGGAFFIVLGLVGATKAQGYVNWQVRTFGIAPDALRWYVRFVRLIGILQAFGGLFLLAQAFSPN